MLVGILAMFVGLTLLVAVHEFGHWIVARMFGMWTPVFAVGFGPRKYSLILGRFWDTEFRLSPILLGGYVAIPELGDETSAQDAAASFTEEKRELRHFAVWKRFCVACAGVVMNVLFAVVLIFGLYAVKGQPDPVATGTFIAAVSDQVTVARDAGLKAKDLILSVDGIRVVDPKPLLAELAARAGKPVVLHIRRAAAEIDVSVVPNADGKIGISVGVEQEMRFKPIGIGEAAVRSVNVTGQNLGMITYAVLGMLHIVPATAGVEPHSIVGIFQFGSDAFAAGAVQFISVLVALSLNLAVFNILPVPMLDGGYVVFLAIEKLRGKPLEAEIQNRLRMFFLLALLLLMAWGTVNDFRHPLGK